MRRGTGRPAAEPPQRARRAHVCSCPASAAATSDRCRSSSASSLIWTVFQALNPVFLSSTNLVEPHDAVRGDRHDRARHRAGAAASARSTCRSDPSPAWPRRCSPSTFVQLQWNLALALAAAIGAGCLVGLLYGFLYTRFGLPSFVITLAGLLGFLGLQLWVLGDDRVDQPAVRLVDRLVRPADVPARLGVVRRRGARRRRLRLDRSRVARGSARRRTS